MTEAQALGMLDYESCYTVARFGELGGWSFAVESGAGSNALLESDRISSGGVELVHFNPQPDHPPSLFSYAKDGHSVCFFPFLSERVENGGSQPDLLVPAMKEFGVLDGEGRRVPWGDGQSQSAAEAMACTFAAIEAHFGLSLPRDAVVDGRLPTSVTVRDEPRFW
ncbi:hypothetical protein G3I78_39150 [Streptomyces sp. SID13726]|nr:hypothetical protein [Streptomyces sp. SID13726]